MRCVLIVGLVFVFIALSVEELADIGSIVCAANQYKSGDACLACPLNSVSMAGSTTLDACVCLPGFSKAANTCAAEIVCAANQYRAGDGCLPCPVNSSSPAGSTSPRACVRNSGMHKIDEAPGLLYWFFLSIFPWSVILFFAWRHKTLLLHHFVTTFLQIVAHTFFKSLDVIGIENVPAHGPIILVSNHQNQFVDALVLGVTSPRQASFLVAEKSTKHKIIGFFTRQLQCIPIVRPQDLASVGQGKVSCIQGEKKLYGEGTDFVEKVKPGDLIKFNGMEVKVDGVFSETEIDTIDVVDKTLENCEYKIVPKVDQSQMYSAVFSALGSGRCIAIFPEGGSHDNTNLLPLKAGVAIMALGAMSTPSPLYAYCSIIPCGLNYFHGHRFRSRVVVEFGQPLKVSLETAKGYLQDKHKAVSELLALVEQQMRTVTTNVPNYRILTSLYTARALWQPSMCQFNAKQIVQLNHLFALGFEKFQDKEEVKQLYVEVSDYRKLLKKHGMARGTDKPPAGRELVFKLITLVVIGLLALIPGVLLNAPVGMVARLMAWREAKRALKASSVKISGRDVVSSYKIISSMVLLPTWYAFCSIVLICTVDWSWTTTILAILSMPLFSYLGVRLIDQEVILSKQMKPLLMRLIPSYRAEQATIPVLQKELKQKVRALVKQFSSELADEFEQRGLPRNWSLQDLLTPAPTQSQGMMRRTSLSKISSLLSRSQSSNSSGDDQPMPMRRMPSSTSWHNLSDLDI